MNESMKELESKGGRMKERENALKSDAQPTKLCKRKKERKTDK